MVSKSKSGQPEPNVGGDIVTAADPHALMAVVAEKERQLRAMREIAQTVGSSLHLDDLLQKVMRYVTTLMCADRSTLYLVDPEHRELWSKVAQGESVHEIRLAFGQGLAGWVADHGVVLNIGDAYDDERFNPEVDKQTGYRTRSVLALPVRNARAELLGVVQVLNKENNGYFGAADETLLEALSSQIAVAIENAQLYTAAMRRNEELRRTHVRLAQKMKELDLLFDVEQTMSHALTTDDLLNTVLARTLEIVDAEAGSIVLFDDATQELYFKTVLGSSVEVLKRMRFDVGEGIAGWVVQLGQPALVNDVEADPRHNAQLAQAVNYAPKSILCVPLPGPSGALGAIELLNKREQRDFGGDDLRLMTLVAGQVSKALSAARERDSREKNTRLVAIGQMLSSIVHDFKTPMTAISGYVELMSMSASEDERYTFAQVVYRQIDQLQEMIKELLQFARGQTEVLLHKVYLDRFVDEIVPMLQREFDASQSSLVIDNSFSGSAFMDENKMYRVLHNIARNAIQAMEPQGGGIFTLRLGSDDGHLVFQCIDTGPGLAAEIEDHLFEYFATHGKEDGTGLGLAIVKKIVDEHHGVIEVESQTGHGTVFKIRVPLIPGPRHQSDT